MLRFTCGKCQHCLKVKTVYMGRQFHCPECETAYVIDANEEGEYSAIPLVGEFKNRRELRSGKSLLIKSVLLILLLVVGGTSIIYFAKMPSEKTRATSGTSQPSQLPSTPFKVASKPVSVDSAPKQRSSDDDLDAKQREAELTRQRTNATSRATLKAQMDILRSEIVRKNQQIADLDRDQSIALSLAVVAANLAIDAADPGFEREVVRGIAQAGINEIKTNYQQKISAVRSAISDLEFRLRAKEVEYFGIR